MPYITIVDPKNINDPIFVELLGNKDEPSVDNADVAITDEAIQQNFDDSAAILSMLNGGD